ncbi:unnamed protein product [Rotaria sp. Silwood2]|nr:unnamed protein product [Rotaria sp. Silwood2]CAF2665967.1 unnamed protein product [Rotaria sp. Silwood2]CAF2775334.1 unnamed protein product [Rotaria sp. Silwood2]CAF3426780.1 unnamed protein product [Rotaria sp. Silwood2]CAF3928184.1 unnamed protein product [Rotaria sp. Silwood2]
MESAQWNRFSDIENTIIEDAFTTLKKPYVILDDYHIDFEHQVQISNDDKSKQRPVKRAEMNKDEGRLREARFMPNPIVPDSSFHDLVGFRKLFIDSFIEFFDLKHVKDWEKRKHDILEKAMLGILHEGKLAGKQCEAKWIVQQLEKVKDKTKKEIGECCIYLYSLESFLYKILNQTMRLIGDKNHENVWRSKVETLGPFAFLLYYYLSYENLNQRTNTTVYRGAQLTDKMIAEYQYVAQSNDPRRSFQAFTSCSRSRAKAEQFGNALFVLNAENRISYSTLNMDISFLSAYPEEEEVLIRPGRSFKIESVTFEKTKKKHVIYLTLISTNETN